MTEHPIAYGDNDDADEVRRTCQFKREIYEDDNDDGDDKAGRVQANDRHQAGAGEGASEPIDLAHAG